MKDIYLSDSEHILHSTEIKNFKLILESIKKTPKRTYNDQELDEARGNLALMHDRVFFGTFDGNKNMHIITALVNALRKIHYLSDIEPIEQIELQKVSMEDVLLRGQVGDLLGLGRGYNIVLEVQKGKQDGFAVRGTITSSNATRIQFKIGADFTEAPDVIGINILGFRLPELEERSMFFSRIVRSEYESGIKFLADKYSEYYIELPKMRGLCKEELPERYHELWDLCCIFSAKVKNHEEVIRVQKIKTHAALELSSEIKKTVAPKNFIAETVDTEDELERFALAVIRMQNKKISEAKKEAYELAEKKAVELVERKAEEMLILALQSHVPVDAIEILRNGAGITKTRLAELKEIAKQT